MATAVTYAVLVITAITVFLFLLLLGLRLVVSSRERRLDAKKEHLNSLLMEILTEGRSARDIVATLGSVVPKGYRRALEIVMLENIKALSGREREALSEAFDELGYVDEDIRGLRRPGLVRNAESAFHLGVMRAGRAVPYLVEGLYSKKPEVSFACLNALSKIGTHEALEAVVGYLSSATDIETMRVAEVLLERKQEFSGYLMRWLETEEPDRQKLMVAIDIMGAMKDAHAVPVLSGFLEHPDGRVRSTAALALGTIGDYSACGALMESLGDEDAGVRAEAAEALGKLQCDEAVQLLREGLSDDDLVVKMNSAIALSQLGEEGKTVLEEGLLAIEKTERLAAAEALDKLGVSGGNGGGEA